MPLLPCCFERLRSVLNGRMADLTVLMEAVESPTTSQHPATRPAGV